MALHLMKCMLHHFHDLSLLLRNSNPNKSDVNHKMVNKVMGNKSDKRKNKNKNDKKIKHDDYYSPDEWPKLMNDQCKQICKDCKKKKANTSLELLAAPGNLPMQYGGHSLCNTVNSSTPLSLEECQMYRQAVQSGGTALAIPSNASQAVNLLQSIPHCSGQVLLNNVRISLSAMMQSVLLNQNSTSMDVPLDGYVATMCINGGTNISMMGRIFKDLEYSDRTIDMVGFAIGIEKRHVHIASGVAVFESGNDKILVGLHEVPYLPDNTLSLLSTGQAWEHGVRVDDVLTHHGGHQLIQAHDVNGNPYDFPLEVCSGLMEFTLRYPTDAEVESLPVVWLTADSPWDLNTLELHDFKVLPSFDDFIKVLTNLVKLQHLDETITYMSKQNGDFRVLACSAPAVGAFFLGALFVHLFNGLSQAVSPVTKPVSRDFSK